MPEDYPPLAKTEEELIVKRISGLVSEDCSFQKAAQLILAERYSSTTPDEMERLEALVTAHAL